MRLLFLLFFLIIAAQKDHRLLFLLLWHRLCVQRKSRVSFSKTLRAAPRALEQEGESLHTDVLQEGQSTASHIYCQAQHALALKQRIAQIQTADYLGLSMSSWPECLLLLLLG